MASSYTTFPSQSQTYTGTATLTSIVPAKTASLALSYTPPISAGTNPATRFLSTPSIASSSDNGAGNPDLKLALGLGLGLGLSALLALLVSVQPRGALLTGRPLPRETCAGS